MPEIDLADPVASRGFVIFMALVCLGLVCWGVAEARSRRAERSAYFKDQDRDRR